MRWNARDARNIELTGGGVFHAHTATVVVNLQGAPRLAIQASKTFAAHTATVAVIWRAAMPPGMVMGLMLLEMGHVFLRIMWLQPDHWNGPVALLRIPVERRRVDVHHVAVY